MGLAVTPKVGTYKCGQNKVGTWRTTWDTPELVLGNGTFSITITEGPLLSLSVNRPVLFLNAKPYAKGMSTSKSFAGPKLTLLSRPFIIQPYITLAFNKAKLTLLSRAFALGLSAQLAFGRPVLILVGGRIRRLGAAVLVPTIPETITPTPTVPALVTLVPTIADGVVLTPSGEEDGTGLLVPTELEEGPLLIPTSVEVR